MEDSKRTSSIIGAVIVAWSIGVLMGIYTAKGDAEKKAREWCAVWREPTAADYVKPYDN